MHFVSLDWLAWIVGTVSLFWIIPGKFRHDFLAFWTLLFLGVYAPISAAILCLFTLATYYPTQGRTVSGYKTAAVVMLIIGVLGFYKSVESSAPEDLINEVIIPLGLSYYALRCVHYVFERYKGELEGISLRQYITYLFFLPTIVVGPIHRIASFRRDLRRHRWDARMLSEGFERILYGYVKITFLANYLVSGEFARFIGSLGAEDQRLALYLEVVRGGLNLYLQFSGFSDVAIGFARLLGFRVMENFKWPYLQKNISDFWKCWHISLTSWCRDYVYSTAFSISRSPAVGALATLLVIGLWHEVSLRYLVWGVYHGLGIVVWQRFQIYKTRVPQIKFPFSTQVFDVLSILFTVHFVWFGFVIVRQPTLTDAWAIILTIFGIGA